MRLIDADRLNEVVNKTLETLVMLPVFSLQEVHLKTAFQTLTDMINNAPIIDAVPVVRCKDCIHHEDELPSMVYCSKVVGSWVSNDWFCADGERKDDADE